MDTRPHKRQGTGPRRTPVGSSNRTGKDMLAQLAGEFSLSADDVKKHFRSCGINPDQDVQVAQMPLYREILSCRLGRFSSYESADKAKAEVLDAYLRSFDEIFVDTAPIIQEDWFLRFVADAYPMLKRRKKKLVVLEKTMEELHGLKDNPEKDREVRLRALVRPELIRHLARMGVVRIQDTGSTGIADDHLVTLFSLKRDRESLLLITQDRGLSERIVRLSEMPLDAPSEELRKKGFLARLFGRGRQEAANRKMHVCRFDTEGNLARCYVCPDCNESYYDSPEDGSGMIVCQVCYELRRVAGQLEAQVAPIPGSIDASRYAGMAEKTALLKRSGEVPRKEDVPAPVVVPPVSKTQSDVPVVRHKHVDPAEKRARTIADVLKRKRQRKARALLLVGIILVCGSLFVSLTL